MNRVGVWCRLWGKIVWADLRSIRVVDGVTKVMAYIDDEYVPHVMQGVNLWMIDPATFTGGSADMAVDWISKMEARERLLAKGRNNA